MCSQKTSERKQTGKDKVCPMGKEAKGGTCPPGTLSGMGHPGFEGIPLEEEPALHHQVLLGNAAEVTT